ncbi:MAG: GNAT family N-acetyltransferase [Defluviitaleaceae bacterium]|nr:GNAT family N-acetyltransferase [Defluviitaleaceae bacterium]MCL2275903.1 GNAT family N-acetyltransferase [Defluviitaleaceae bacterium]
MMEIRKITQNERIYYSKINLEVFFDGDRWDLRQALANPPEKKEETEQRKENPVWAAFENGKMLSAMMIHDYTWCVNNHAVRMGGIGGVVTVPEARGQGLVRRIFRPAFDEMYEVGQVYSFLYPFHYDYYRKFGYEIGYTYRTATVPVEQFTRFSYPKNIQPHEPNHPHEPYAAIYNTFADGRNLCTVRNEEAWKRMLKRDPYKKMQFTFLNYDANGTPNAYVLYNTEIKGHEGGNVINIRELCWTTPEGLFNIFGLFGKLGSEYTTVRWEVPIGVNLQALLPDPYSVHWRNHSGGMNRIVDVPAALSMQSAPAGSGYTTLAITDNFRPDNSGIYRLEWEDNNLTAKKSSDTTAEMEMNVTTLAQLVTGYINPKEARYRTDVAINGDIEKLNLVFPKKELYLYERF